jgi:type-F conjugative transfer system secretin TraK
MAKPFILLFLLGSLITANATTVRNFTDNETLTVELSKTNYNRLLVPDDKIHKVRCPEKTLAIDYAVDGSVYIDLLVTEPLTVFVTTKTGHNFSMTVKPVESLGQTIQFVPKTPTKQARHFEKKTPQDETVTKLIQAMMNNQTPQGYGVKSVFSSYRPVNKELTYKVTKQFIGEAYQGEILTIYNRTHKPVTLDESLFKNNDTRAFAVSQPIIAPKGSETIYLVKETGHA